MTHFGDFEEFSKQYLRLRDVAVSLTTMLASRTETQAINYPEVTGFPLMGWARPAGYLWLSHWNGCIFWTPGGLLSPSISSTDPGILA